MESEASVQFEDRWNAIESKCEYALRKRRSNLIISSKRRSKRLKDFSIATTLRHTGYAPIDPIQELLKSQKVSNSNFNFSFVHDVVQLRADVVPHLLK